MRNQAIHLARKLPHLLLGQSDALLDREKQPKVLARSKVVVQHVALQTHTTAAPNLVPRILVKRRVAHQHVAVVD